MPPTATPPTLVQFPSEKLTLGAGVAIFHIASERVVVCYHTRDKYYFLPKGIPSYLPRTVWDTD